MNKVVSIEIARQVFWVEDQAYEVLQSYLKKIRQQLADDECAGEIFKDIELRIAELFYSLNCSESRAIDINQLDEVIEQVGFIDSEEINVESPRKIYRDLQNKILGGVCAGLAIRFGVPAFVIRVVFVALTALFGLGIVLYLIFWISLDATTDRNSALAARGKARTARQIAAFDAPKENPFVQLQKIIFLPVSIAGALVTVVGNHFRKRRHGYHLIFKNMVAAVLLLATIFFAAAVYGFNQSRFFSPLISWLLSAAAIYLVVLVLATYFRRYYLERPKLNVARRLKAGALIPIAMIALAAVFLTRANWEHHGQLVERSFPLNGGPLTLAFNDEYPDDEYAKWVRYRVRTGSDVRQVKLHVNYGSSGYSNEAVLENIQAIDYFFTFEDNTLKLDRYWTLKEGALNRGQSVDVVIEIPQDTLVASSKQLHIAWNGRDYYYYANFSYSDENLYLASGPYFHEYDDDYKNRLSSNERRVLVDKFCDEFFISESWACSSNIQRPVTENSRFDRAFQKDSELVDGVRQFLLPDRSLFVSSLSEMNHMIDELSIQYPVMSDLQQYIEHLMEIKNVADQPVHNS